MAEAKYASTKPLEEFEVYKRYKRKEELIRCKDCSYWDSGWCDYHEGTMEADDYCSRGERREDDNK